MKTRYISALLVVISLFVYAPCAQADLTFTNHKDRAGSLERVFLQELIKTFGTPVFVETGSTNGDTLTQAAALFSQVHTVKRQAAVAKNIKHHFARQPHVTVYQGNSYEAFMKMLPALKNQKLLFYLGDHYDKNKQRIPENPLMIENITEIRRELAAIKQCGISNCVILIDNIHQFGSTVDTKMYAGYWAYPSLSEVYKSLLAINSNFEYALIGDMLLAYDKHTSVARSPLVKACTISRLFDDAQYNEDDLLQAEKTIAAAQGTERAYLKQLCQNTMACSFKEFHAQLWYGLLSLDEKSYSEALRSFDNVLARPYDHWRIKHYRMLTRKSCALSVITKQEFLRTILQ